MKQAIVQEIINDILSIDPELKSIKSELEKLVQELITNKPETPFTQDFKDSLKAQIISAINEHKISHATKDSGFVSILHSFRFWMVGISSITTCLLVWGIFQYFDGLDNTNTQITYLQNNPDLNNTIEKPEISDINNSIEKTNNINIKSREKSITTESTKDNEEIANIDSNIDMTNDEGASARTDNVMMIPEPQEATETAGGGESNYNMMAKSIVNTEADLSAINNSNEVNNINIPCEASKMFLTTNSIDPETNSIKNFTYKNQIYQAVINHTSNKITIKNIGTKDDTQVETALPDIKEFLTNNNLNISKDYNSAIIEESDSFIEYYFPRYNGEQGITALIDKTNNIIFSIDNICIY